MKNAAWCLVALGMVAGCGSNARPATDGGVTTPDTGTTPGNDAATQVDAFTGPCGSLTGPYDALPASCTPRCTRATLTAAMGCGTDATCLRTALENDTTPVAQVTAGGQTYEFACIDCYSQAVLYGQAMFCQTELDALATCAAGHNNMPAMCPAEVTAVNDCSNTHMSEIQTAVQGPLVACFSQT